MLRKVLASSSAAVAACQQKKLGARRGDWKCAELQWNAPEIRSPGSPKHFRASTYHVYMVTVCSVRHLCN